MAPSESSTPDQGGGAPPGSDRAPIEVRPATEADLPQILDLAGAALGWRPDDPNEDFFRWKHFDNPAGRSPMWLATAAGRPVGFRVFLRWRFRAAGGVHDGDVIDAVRAVDTATHPDFRGRGIFSRLTLGALDELRDEGVEFVFNTPNDRSRPGYLKMGWREVGRVSIDVRPRTPLALVRMAQARVAAEKWSSATDVGVAAPDALADPTALERLLDRVGSAVGAGTDGHLTTDRSIAHLRWRYDFAPLRYRAVVGPGGVADGLVVFRLRRRGPATEAVLCEVLVPEPATGRALVSQLARATRADYVIAAGRPDRRARFVPAPGLGPILTWRQVAAGAVAPTLDDLDLTMGDVELF